MRYTMRILAFFVAGLLLLASPAARAFDIERVVSPGGIEAWLVADDSVPILSISFAFRGGSSVDPVGKEGVAQFVSAMLNEGAGDLERYRQFCVGRARGLAEAHAERFPAATAIGRQNTGHDVQVFWLAARSPGRPIPSP